MSAGNYARGNLPPKHFPDGLVVRQTHYRAVGGRYPGSLGFLEGWRRHHFNIHVRP